MKKSKTMAAGIAPYNEKEWRAKDDARVLAQAQAIKSDKTRLGAAAKMAKTMIEEKKAEVKGLQAAARSAPKGRK